MSFKPLPRNRLKRARSPGYGPRLNWSRSGTKVKTYVETLGKQVQQQQATFRDVAAAQVKAWREAADKLHEEAAKVAAARRADVDAAVKQMKADAAQAEARLQKLKQAKKTRPARGRGQVKPHSAKECSAHLRARQPRGRAMAPRWTPRRIARLAYLAGRGAGVETILQDHVIAPTSERAVRCAASRFDVPIGRGAPLALELALAERKQLESAASLRGMTMGMLALALLQTIARD
jgi:hypothetical protein